MEQLALLQAEQRKISAAKEPTAAPLMGRGQPGTREVLVHAPGTPTRWLPPETPV